MLLNSPHLDNLVEAFRLLPGIGKRSAERAAMFLLSAPPGISHRLAEAIVSARDRIRKCSVCQDLTDEDPCRICASLNRDSRLLCIVEHPAGAAAIERSGSFSGKYYVLHGVISPLDGIGPKELGLDRLQERIAQDEVAEVIVATNATLEGENTAAYLARILTPMGVKVSRIAHGVPMGGGLEFTDDATLAHALEGRRSLE